MTRQLHDGGFQDELQVDSPQVPRQSTVTKPSRLSGGEPMEVDPEVRKRMRRKTRTVITDQPIAPSSNVTTDTARQETEGDHDDTRRRVGEPETSLSAIAQNEALVLELVSTDMEKREDEITADVPLPEEQPEGMGSDQPQGWITQEAFFNVSLTTVRFLGQQSETTIDDTWPQMGEMRSLSKKHYRILDTRYATRRHLGTQQTSVKVRGIARRTLFDPMHDGQPFCQNLTERRKTTVRFPGTTERGKD